MALKLITPMRIFASYQIAYESRIVQNIFWSFLLVAIAFAVQIPLAHLLIRKQGNPDYQVERMSVIFPNCGFFGIPLIESLFGSEGTIYIAVYVTVFNILLWSVGTMIMSGRPSLRQMLKSFASPAVIATVLGLGTLLLRIQIPSLIMETINAIAAMNTPFAMIVAGGTLASTHILPCLKELRVYRVLLYKMLLVPAAAALVLSLVPLDSMLVMIPAVATSCPTGAVCTMFAILYDKNSAYASQLFAVTTVSSIVTIPLIFMFAKIFI